MFNFFLCELPLILTVSLKQKNWAKGICRGTLDIECERDWSVSLGAMLDDEYKFKNYFSSFLDFPGKADSVILLVFECTINPQNLIKIVGAIFEEMKILNFFLMWTTLNFGGRSKTKKWASDICGGDHTYRMWTRSASWFRRYVRRRIEN